MQAMARSAEADRLANPGVVDSQSRRSTATGVQPWLVALVIRKEDAAVHDASERQLLARNQSRTRVCAQHAPRSILFLPLVAAEPLRSGTAHCHRPY